MAMSSPSTNQSLVNKGKDCIMVAKSALDDIGSGRKQMAVKKLSTLQRDSSDIAHEAEKLAERLEAVEKYYQHKDAEILREIGELVRNESEKKREKSEEESELAARQSVLRDNQQRLSFAKNRLRVAKQKLQEAEEREEKIRLGCATVGEVLTLGPVGRIIGIGQIGDLASGAIAQLIISCRGEEKDARDALNRRLDDLNSVNSAVEESERRVSYVVSQITSMAKQIESLKQQRHYCQEKVGIVRNLIAVAKQSIQFWLLFKQLSEHGIDRTALLQKIVSMATGKKNSNTILQSRSSQRIARSFVEAWEEMESTALYGGPNHILKIEYRCSRCSIQYTALPYVDGSSFICMECHTKYALKN